MDETLQSSIVFQTYATVLNLLNKSLLLLAEKGADQRTLSFMVQSINSLIQNINSYAGDLAMEKKWNEELDRICARYNITRADDSKNDDVGGEG